MSDKLSELLRRNHIAAMQQAVDSAEMEAMVRSLMQMQAELEDAIIELADMLGGE